MAFCSLFRRLCCERCTTTETGSDSVEMDTKVDTQEQQNLLHDNRQRIEQEKDDILENATLLPVHQKEGSLELSRLNCTVETVYQLEYDTKIKEPGTVSEANDENEGHETRNTSDILVSTYGALQIRELSSNNQYSSSASKEQVGSSNNQYSSSASKEQVEPLLMQRHGDVKEIPPMDSTPEFQICVDSQSISVHKKVLSGYSDYFRAMFEPNTKESSEGVMHIHDTPGHIMRTVIRFMYGEVVYVEWTDVEDFVDIAHMWLLQEVECLLECYIEKNCGNNCIYWYFLADAYPNGFC